MAKRQVNCAWCSGSIMRHPDNPSTGKPISNFFCDKSCKGSWQARQRENEGFTREWLEDQYLTQGKGAYQIGREIGRNGKRVWEWLKYHNIPTRPRGHNAEKNLVKDGSSFKGRKHSKSARDKIKASWVGRDLSSYANNGAHIAAMAKEDHPNWKGGITPERQSVYASREWAEAVKAVWSRDNAICQRCGKNHNDGSNRGTFHIHHIASFRHKERRCDPENLILLCRPCHLWVHSRKNINGQFISKEA